MPPSSDDIPVVGHPSIPPIFDLCHEWHLPRTRLLCVLEPRGETVEATVNTAHGLVGYRHAAYHAAQGVDGLRACILGEPCGYAEEDVACGAGGSH
jgi:hypothetical protein